MSLASSPMRPQCMPDHAGWTFLMTFARRCMPLGMSSSGAITNDNLTNGHGKGGVGPLQCEMRPAQQMAVSEACWSRLMQAANTKLLSAHAHSMMYCTINKTCAIKTCHSSQKLNL